MVGQTLHEMRERIDALADAEGRYYVACARTGDQPYPTTGHRFATRDDAADAAEVATAYRDALRRYDPRTAQYDLVVHETTVGAVREGAATDLSSFCHDVVGAVFESLAANDHDTAERAVMDTYLAAAEDTVDLDHLCVRLLDSLAVALDDHLSADEQATVLAAAADRLPPIAHGVDPVEEAFAHLRSLSLVDDCTVTRDGEQWAVTLGSTRLATGPRLATLPVTVALLRRRPDADVGIRAVDGDRGWRLDVSLSASDAAGLATVA